MSHTTHLNNYLTTHRMRAGLSQKEFAFLLGFEGSTGRKRVGKYERDDREPNLETLLAIEAALGVRVSDVFAGRKHKVEARTRRRAQELIGQLEQEESTPLTQYKIERLRELLASEPETNHVCECEH